jgi:hypothetical protein
VLKAVLAGLFGLVLMTCQPGMADSAAGKRTGAKPPADPPMRVVLVRSSEQGCEPNCTEWIYAEGRITAATPREFRAAFRRIGKLRLPVIINSYGGDVNAALSIGRLIRQRQAVVLVGETLFHGCQPQDKACKPEKQKRGRYSGSYVVFPGYCLSACGLVLAGGSMRFSHVRRIGTHQIVQTGGYERVWYRETYRMVKGKKKVISRKITKRQKVTLKPTTKIASATRKKIDSYLAGMGVDASYAALFEKAPPSGMYMLSAEDMSKTQIARTPMTSASMMRKELCQTPPAAPHCVRLDASP